jgi:hypothetical protein
MKISQQIVGVNQRLGNTAVPNMQGTTRVIYDTSAALAAVTTTQTLTFFSGVSTRLYPLSNISNNRFEVGESLAIQGFAFMFRPSADITAYSAINVFNSSPNSAGIFLQQSILNFYIGNQRIIKDLPLDYSKFGIGEAYASTSETNVLRLETPIVIPPQIEFYATLSYTAGNEPGTDRIVLAAFGQGTLLNTKSTF